jgi:hypothetical protein
VFACVSPYNHQITGPAHAHWATKQLDSLGCFEIIYQQQQLQPKNWFAVSLTPEKSWDIQRSMGDTCCTSAFWEVIDPRCTYPPLLVSKTSEILFGWSDQICLSSQSDESPLKKCKQTGGSEVVSNLFWSIPIYSNPRIDRTVANLDIRTKYHRTSILETHSRHLSFGIWSYYNV